jgi:hypothetical protein
VSTGARAFDFLVGSWTVRHRLWSDRLDGWLRFESGFQAWPILDGAGNMDVTRIAGLPPHPFVGSSIRVHDPSDDSWSIGWVDNLSCRFGTVVRGRLVDGRGEFHGMRQEGDRLVAVRFRWRIRSADRAAWDQAWSRDGGSSWEPRWVMRFRRTGASSASEGAPP